MPRKNRLKNDRTSYVAVCFWLPIFPQRAGRSDSCCVKRSGCLSGDGYRKWQVLVLSNPSTLFSWSHISDFAFDFFNERSGGSTQANGIEADFLNSSQTLEQQQQVENKLISGQLKLLYVSPEK